MDAILCIIKPPRDPRVKLKVYESYKIESDETSCACRKHHLPIYTKLDNRIWRINIDFEDQSHTTNTNILIMCYRCWFVCGFIMSLFTGKHIILFLYKNIKDTSNVLKIIFAMMGNREKDKRLYVGTFSEALKKPY